MSTGTMVGVSTGLEPYFSFTYYRSGRLGRFIEVKADILQDYLEANPDVNEDNIPDWFVSSMELTPEEHVNVQCTIQHWIDSSISKTVNAPKGYTVDDVKKIYESLYEKGAKGGTVYVDGSRDSQVLSLTKDEDKTNDDGDDYKVQNEKRDKKTAKIVVLNEKKVGNEVGDTCPTCEVGVIEFVAGCNTCTNCGHALSCGL